MTQHTITATHPIRPVAADDATTVAATLAAAFQDDPVFTWCIPDQHHRASVLPEFFRLAFEAVSPGGEATVGEDGLAAALWVPAGEAAVSDPDAFGFALAQLIGDGIERTFSLMGLLDEIHPTTPHRFLWFIGTHPDAQGHGRGAALLRHTLTMCDTEGIPAALDATSDQNRRLYERHGFEVVGRHTVADSPPLWSMWRAPRPSR